MSDQSGYTPFTPYPESPRPPSEPVCTMRKDTVGCRIALRDDEHVNAGVELQLFRNDEFLRGRRFATRALAMAEVDVLHRWFTANGWIRVDETTKGGT